MAAVKGASRTPPNPARMDAQAETPTDPPEAGEGLRRLPRVLGIAADRYYGDRCPQLAAGIAYRVLFSIAPLAIVVVSLFGLVLGREQLQDLVVDTIANALPATAQNRTEVTRAISSVASPSSPLGLVTLLLFVWAATGMMASIRGGLEAAMHVPRGRPPARGKLVDLGLVLAAAVLVLATVALTVLDQLVQHALRSLGGGLAGAPAAIVARLFALVVAAVIVLVLYRFVPNRRLEPGEALAGAVTTAVLLLAISLLSSRAYGGIDRLSAVYGSLTTALVVLYSIYLYASARLFGAEVAAAWSAPPQVGAPPLRAQLRRTVRGFFRVNDRALSPVAAAPSSPDRGRAAPPV